MCAPHNRSRRVCSCTPLAQWPGRAAEDLGSRIRTPSQAHLVQMRSDTTSGNEGKFTPLAQWPERTAEDLRSRVRIPIQACLMRTTQCNPYAHVPHAMGQPRANPITSTTRTQRTKNRDIEKQAKAAYSAHCKGPTTRWKDNGTCNVNQDPAAMC